MSKFHVHSGFWMKIKYLKKKTPDHWTLCCNILRPQASVFFFQVFTVIPSVSRESIFKSVLLKIKPTSRVEAHLGGLPAQLARVNPEMICRINGRASSIKGIFRDPLLRPPSKFQGNSAAYSSCNPADGQTSSCWNHNLPWEKTLRQVAEQIYSHTPVSTALRKFIIIKKKDLAYNKNPRNRLGDSYLSS